MAATKYLSNSEIWAFQGGEVPHCGLLDVDTLFVVWYAITPCHQPHDLRKRLNRFGVLQFAVGMADRWAGT
jgi:hypothetical protein